MPPPHKPPRKETAPVKANDIRPGVALNLDGQLFVVIGADHVKPGKGPAYVQVKLKSVATGSVSQKRLRAEEVYEQAVLDRRTMQYLYADATGQVFMDNETYDQINMPEDLLGDAMQYLKPNTDVTVLMYEGRPLSIDLPTVVDLEITETTPQPKGATATNQLKEATLETGLTTRVPPFIETGETVRISTVDGSYVSRA
ncbi:elongation factor P [Planctomycetales bacterium ZRK34]|nr:elongation factor P [Planctomycetales bacterium ZRK34]